MNEYLEYSMLFLAGLVGGALNAIAGGGGFITFPSLIFAGANQVNASAISTVALWPGNMASAKAFQDDIKISKRSVIYLLVIAGLGGLVGAYLLVTVSPKTFEFLVPYFLLTSWLMFAFSGKILNFFRAHINVQDSFEYSHRKAIPLFLLSIYGGYFGAGLGMMILTLFTLYGMNNLNEMNGLKVLMVSVNNGIAAIAFIISGIIVWNFAIVMFFGAIIGGYYGASLTRTIPQSLVKKVIIVIGGVITLYFFIYK